MAKTEQITCRCEIIDYPIETIHLPTPGWKFQFCDIGHVCGKWKISDEEWEKRRNDAR